MFTEVDVYEFQSALHLCVVLNSTVATQVVIEVTTQSGTATGMEFTSLCCGNTYSHAIAWYRFWPKTIVHSFIFWSPKNVLRKVCHSLVNEKRNLMALVSVVQHLRVWSY